jgi:hypothetical protein
VSPADGYHPDFATITSRHPVILQNGIGEPLKFKFSRLLLIESSTFFDGLFSLPQVAMKVGSPLSLPIGETLREPHEPIELPFATSDGLALLLRLLSHRYSGEPLPWPDLATLSNFITLVVALDLACAARVLLQLSAPPSSSGVCFERFGLSVATGLDVDAAARATVLAKVKDMNVWTIDLLQTSPAALVVLLQTHLEWQELLREFAKEFNRQLRGQFRGFATPPCNAKGCTTFDSITPTLISLLHKEWETRPDTRTMLERGQAVICTAVETLTPRHCKCCSPDPDYVTCFSLAFERVIKPFISEHSYSARGWTSNGQGEA